jgi:hypothetical protein
MNRRIELRREADGLACRCGGRLEAFVALTAALHPEATQTERRGPRAGQPFHVAATCESCHAVAEILPEPAAEGGAR